jgi:hypothetical protein
MNFFLKTWGFMLCPALRFYSSKRNPSDKTHDFWEVGFYSGDSAVFGQKTDRFDIYLLIACSKFLQQKQKTKMKIPQKHFIFVQIFLGKQTQPTSC